MNALSNPLVSVIIPSYNHADFVIRALQSVMDQSWKNIEVIIIDNYSTDNTQAVLEPWLAENVRLFKIHNNGIIAKSRNKGLAEARGEWIAFLDADDWWSKEKLERCMKIALNGADVIYHDLAIIDSNCKFMPWRRSLSRFLGNRPYETLIHDGCALPNSSVVVKKTILKSIGGISEDRELVGWEDFDTWLRLAKIGSKFARLKGTYGYYWVGGGNISNPQRTLSNINSFIERYVATTDQIPWWCYYSRAVAFHALDMRDLIGPNFLAAWHAKPSLQNRIRILCKWLILR